VKTVTKSQVIPIDASVKTLTRSQVIPIDASTKIKEAKIIAGESICSVIEILKYSPKKDSFQVKFDFQMTRTSISTQ
jgi:hypothetical protein